MTSTKYAYAKLTYGEARILVAACEELAQRGCRDWPRRQDVEALQQKLVQLLPTSELRQR